MAGEPPEGGWRIRVQDRTALPDEPAGGPSQVVIIRDGGLATSSTAARRWRRGGDILHHILDPRTGRPAAPVWRTVSVAGATCADANTAATTAIIRGRQALPWLTGLKLPSRLVAKDGTVHTLVKLACGPRLATTSIRQPITPRNRRCGNRRRGGSANALNSLNNHTGRMRLAVAGP